MPWLRAYNYKVSLTSWLVMGAEGVEEEDAAAALWAICWYCWTIGMAGAFFGVNGTPYLSSQACKQVDICKGQGDVKIIYYKFQGGGTCFNCSLSLNPKMESSLWSFV